MANTNHQFIVGRQYRNRDGEYVIVSLSDTEMVIRYLDGRTITSPIELQARIWANLQEEDAGGELDIGDLTEKRGDSRHASRELRDFVNDVLDSVPKPWPPDITDRVFLAIQNHQPWLDYYNKVKADRGPLSVNSNIGRDVSQLTGMRDSGKTGVPRSHLITSYSILRAD
jgi:hypothetical protein